MTTLEAAKALGVSVRRVQAMIADGRLAATKEGRDWKITPEAVEAARNRKPGWKKGVPRDMNIRLSKERAATLINQPMIRLEAVEPHELEDIVERIVLSPKAREVVLSAINDGEAAIWRTRDGLYAVYDDPLFGDPVETHHLAYTKEMGLLVDERPNTRKVQYLLDRINGWVKHASMIGLSAVNHTGGRSEKVEARVKPIQDRALELLNSGVLDKIRQESRVLDTAEQYSLEAVTTIYHTVETLRSSLPVLPSDDELMDIDPDFFKAND